MPRRLLSFPSVARSDYGGGPSSRWAPRLAEASVDLSGELREGALSAVHRHAALVKRAEPDDFLVMLRDVHKRFGGEALSFRSSTVAVEGLSLGIPEGHCFGLLGAVLPPDLLGLKPLFQTVQTAACLIV
jgi:hypothetical protein